MPKYVSFLDMWQNSFVFNNASQIYLYYFFYFLSLLMLSFSKFISKNFNNEFSYWYIFSFVFLIGLPPMPMFFLKLSILFYFFKHLYMVYFMCFLLAFLVLWVASFLFIINNYSIVKTENSISGKNSILFVFGFFIIFYSFFVIENVIAFFCIF